MAYRHDTSPMRRDREQEVGRRERGEPSRKGESSCRSGRSDRRTDEGRTRERDSSRTRTSRDGRRYSHSTGEVYDAREHYSASASGSGRRDEGRHRHNGSGSFNPSHRERDEDRGGHRDGDEGTGSREDHRGHRRRSRSRSRGRDDKRKRATSRSRSRERHRSGEKDIDRNRHRRRRSRSEDTASSDDSASSSDSEDERRRKRRKERRREDKEDRKRRKERKKEKKAKKDKGTAASTGSWGKYGIITETDMPRKDSEFRAWLVEERKLNPENISKDRTRKEFAVFVEDYNTATLPHEKYYDLAKYDFRMNLIRSGQTIPLEGSYDPLADMKAHTSHVKSMEEKKASKLTREDIMELRRVEAERIEIGKRRLLGQDVPRNMGVRTEQVALESVNYD